MQYSIFKTTNFVVLILNLTKTVYQRFKLILITKQVIVKFERAVVNTKFSTHFLP